MASLGTTSVPAIPDSRIARDATDLIRSVESDLLYHTHCACTRGVPDRASSAACAMTPNCSTSARCSTTSGLVEGHRSEHDRLEVDGANAARDFLRAHGVSGDALRIVWDAIALQTTRVSRNTRCPKSL
jgi:hypothetical protein